MHYNLVPSCGWLFEYFMWTSSGYSGHRRWIQLITLHERNENPIFSDAFQDELIEGYGSLFMGWLLFHIGSIGSHGRRQLFYITFTNHYFGLSRQGIDILASYGYGVTLDMFDKMHKTTELKSIYNIKYTYMYIYVHLYIHVVSV